MSLTVSRISFQNFRNYELFELDDIGLLTVLVGPNAVGKTNIVEGLQLMTALTSFRHPTISQLVRQGADFARVTTEVSDENRQLDISMRISEGKRRYRVNGKPKRPSDLKGVVPAVAFTPDDLELAKGSMSVRRTALDALGSQLSANHYLIRKDYEKVVRYKNRLLKEEADDALVESINETLVTCGAQLVCYRAALFSKLASSMTSYYSTLSSARECLTAQYVPSWDIPHNTPTLSVSAGDTGVSLTDTNSVSTSTTEATPTETASRISRDEAREHFSAALAAARSEERSRHRALVGPHADHIIFRIDGRDAALFGSQGQQRSIVLAFKLAEASVIKEVLGQQPLLLLDDVMSELDAARRAALVEFIANDIQTFITTTNLAYFDEDLLNRARVIKLSRP